MNKLIEIKMPNGIKVKAIVIETIANSLLLCYAQNRLFLVYAYTLKSIIAEYCIIPEYDALLLEK